MVPQWFLLFENDPKKALVDLFCGQVHECSLLPADPNFPEEALVDWLLMIKGENNFSEAIDNSLSIIIRDAGDQGNNGNKKQRRLFWKKILAFLSNKEIQKLLPNTMRILQGKGRVFFRDIISGDSNSLLLEHFDQVFVES